mgnify:CR=1 FL=1
MTIASEVISSYPRDNPYLFCRYNWACIVAILGRLLRFGLHFGLCFSVLIFCAAKLLPVIVVANKETVPVE